MTKLEQVSSNRVSTGTLTKYAFESTSLGGLKTNVNVFVPFTNKPASPVPVLFYLAGLTCNEDTGAQKGGLFNKAGEEGLALVLPDTSPRGAGIEGEDDDWDFGTGAGFYLNATADKWKKHYNMYDLVVEEIPKVLKEADLGLDFDKVSIMGHSMGGHGALTLYLKNLDKYTSASAFAPACNPSRTPWGTKAFQNYLLTRTRSSPPSEWTPYDASHLLSSIDAPKGSLRMLVDTGSADDFLKKGQLEPDALKEAAKASGRGEDEVQIRLQDGYDHSYYFISTFSPEHIAFHAKHLKA
ncbi:putative Carboxylesterase [Kockovaella imperatae]|uniref:S-formylglutathione hydrolase n=1 Tax=Kockovaella imperatae TaxID=4999 RepID=A0A1Y1UHG0_9TREE|nr:putative Carboxylesterase [Kockovaella imperatae]ORX37429.1 putative Carboxylesterase [Kockovaella imperatae]